MNAAGINTLAIPDPQVLVLAEGATDSTIANARGHLFERLLALLLTRYGYEDPVRNRLNVTSQGIELDVTATHGLTRRPAIAECKAYSSPVPAGKLEEFYGKLASRRFAVPDTHGFFVAIPRLTPQGAEQAEVFSGNDPNFTLINYGSASRRCPPRSGRDQRSTRGATRDQRSCGRGH